MAGRYRSGPYNPGNSAWAKTNPTPMIAPAIPIFIPFNITVEGHTLIGKIFPESEMLDSDIPKSFTVFFFSQQPARLFLHEGNWTLGGSPEYQDIANELVEYLTLWYG